MPARRRRSFAGKPSDRIELWDKKMSGDIYAKLLPSLKEISKDRVANYQYVFNQLLDIVKTITSKYGTEGQRVQEYMWYAEELWRATQQFTDKALHNKANSIYVKYLAKGLNDDCLKGIASYLGITPDPPEKIFKLAPAPAPMTFLDLTDTPDSYSGQAGKVVAVKSTEDGLEFTSAPTGISKCIIGFGEAGYVISAGDYTSHQPFSNSKGSSYGMPVPFAGTAKKLKVQVVSNNLDADCRVIVAKNESETSLLVTIPSGQSGLFSNNTDTVSFSEGDRIYFIVDTSSATSGSIDIAGVTIAFEG
ncbi:MAG: hypothetical protein QXY65_02945 [Candidatus Methanomethylicaceae archaeon]